MLARLEAARETTISFVAPLTVVYCRGSMDTVASELRGGIMKVVRVVVLLVAGLLVGYSVGTQATRAENCAQPLTCLGEFECLAYDYFCEFQCSPPSGGECM